MSNQNKKVQQLLDNVTKDIESQALNKWIDKRLLKLEKQRLKLKDRQDLLRSSIHIEDLTERQKALSEISRINKESYYLQCILNGESKAEIDKSEYLYIGGIDDLIKRTDLIDLLKGAFSLFMSNPEHFACSEETKWVQSMALFGLIEALSKDVPEWQKEAA